MPKQAKEYLKKKGYDVSKMSYDEIRELYKVLMDKRREGNKDREKAKRKYKMMDKAYKDTIY